MYIHQPECNGQVGSRHALVDQKFGLSPTVIQPNFCLAVNA